MPDPKPEWTPARVRALCEILDITQAALADRVGVTLRSAQRWISGEREVSRLAAKQLDAIEAQAKKKAK